MEKKKILLCGSTRFEKEYHEVAKKFIMEGHIVLSNPIFLHGSDKDSISEKDKEKLEEKLVKHWRKLAKDADEIYVINKYGYIGKHTKGDIVYAINHDKPIRYMENPSGFKVITICGSTKFEEEYRQVIKDLTLDGYIVLYCPIFHHSSDSDLWNKMSPEEKEDYNQKLMSMHFKRINISDAIYVIDKSGYIGDNTRQQIDYAIENGKTVFYYSNGKYNKERK